MSKEQDSQNAGRATRAEYSAGGVVYRPANGGYEVVAVHRARHHDWSLPKGHIEKGESHEQTALREVEEETGLSARVVEPLGEVVYFFRSRHAELIRKTVYHFLMEYTGGDFCPPNWEVDIARWVAIEEAGELLSYRNDREIVEKAKGRLTGNR